MKFFARMLKHQSRPSAGDSYFSVVAQSWYRKHWSLPSDWFTEAVAHARAQSDSSRTLAAPFALNLRFEGIYKVATVYLNGKLVATYGGSSAASVARQRTAWRQRRLCSA